MGVVRKESVRNTIIYYSGVALGYFNMAVLLPKILQSEQYGLIRFLFPFASILAFFYLVGIPNIILRFFPYLKDAGKKHNGILFFAFSLAGTSTVVVTALFFIFKPIILAEYSKKAALFVEYYYVVFPLAIGITIFEIFNAYNRSLLKTNFAVFINEVYIRIVILVLAILYLQHLFSFKVFLYLFIAAYFSNAVIMAVYTYFRKTLFLSPSKKIFKAPLFKQMINYGLFNFFGGTSSMLMDKIDVLFVGSYLGLADTGVYGIAILMGSAIALPAKALMQVLFPITADAFKHEDYKKLSYLYTSSCSNQLFIGSLVFILVWINFDGFFSVVHPAFLAAKTAFLILAVSRLFDMATGINNLLIINSKYYRFDLYFTTMLIILTVLFNRLLIPRFGMAGAAFATGGSIVVYNIAKYIFIWSKLKLQPFNLETVKIVLTISAIFFISNILPQSGSHIFDMFYKTIAVGLLFLFSLFYVKINPEILQLVLAAYKKGMRFLPFWKNDID